MNFPWTVTEYWLPSLSSVSIRTPGSLIVFVLFLVGLGDERPQLHHLHRLHRRGDRVARLVVVCSPGLHPHGEHVRPGDRLLQDLVVPVAVTVVRAVGDLQGSERYLDVIGGQWRVEVAREVSGDRHAWGGPTFADSLGVSLCLHASHDQSSSLAKIPEMATAFSSTTSQLMALTNIAASIGLVAITGPPRTSFRRSPG